MTERQPQPQKAFIRKEARKSWYECRDDALRSAVLPLSDQSHKGASGRIAILGGSAQYTGAPYYAAMACLKAGADLAYVWTAQEACLPIKCYSPELMVSPMYNAQELEVAENKQKQLQQATKIVDEGEIRSNEEHCKALVEDMVEIVKPQMERIHCLVIGPGLGRSQIVWQAVVRIIQYAILLDLHVVLDADALYMLANNPKDHAILAGYNKAVLTPNAIEYKRLVSNMGQNQQSTSTSQDVQLMKPSTISALQDVIIVQKGKEDLIEINGNILHICEEQGGLKRSGGIGDVLAGTIATLCAWKSILDKQDPRSAEPDAVKNTNVEAESTGRGDDEVMDPLMNESSLSFSCWIACCFVKRATSKAFSRKRRAMTAPDVLEELGPAIDEMTNIT